jgi:uncharacterized repeat protein (TIGR01451 family)
MRARLAAFHLKLKPFSPHREIPLHLFVRLARLILALLGGFILVALWQVVVFTAQDDVQAARLLRPGHSDSLVISGTQVSTQTVCQDIAAQGMGWPCPEGADLAVVKTANDPTPYFGDTVTYTISIVNNGPQDATGVQLIDTLPVSVTLDSATPSQGRCTGTTTVTCDLSSLSYGASATVIMVVTPTEAGLITNIATVAGNEADPVSGNDSDEETVDVIGADLVVTKTVNSTSPAGGDIISYKITLANDGPDDAVGTLLTDQLSEDLTFDGSSATAGTYTVEDGEWHIGNLPAGSNATLTITAKINICTRYATITNTAKVAAEHPNDPCLNNNESRVIITPSLTYRCIYLPIAYKDYLPLPEYSVCHKDEFSDSNSGWITGTFSEADFSYQPQSSPREYQIYSKQDRDIRSASPFGTFGQYFVKVNARWASTPLGDEYGIVFGIQNKDNQRVIKATSLYRFVINTRNNCEWLLRRYEESVGWYTVVEWTINNTAINTDTKLNVLEVRCYDPGIAVYANGSLLRYRQDLPCAGEVGPSVPI